MLNNWVWFSRCVVVRLRVCVCVCVSRTGRHFVVSCWRTHSTNARCTRRCWRAFQCWTRSTYVYLSLCLPLSLSLSLSVSWLLAGQLYTRRQGCGRWRWWWWWWSERQQQKLEWVDKCWTGASRLCLRSLDVAFHRL